MELTFTALRHGSITLHRITEANFEEVVTLFKGFPDSDEMIEELRESYRPEYDKEGRQILYSFYTTLNSELAGISLLGIDSFDEARGYTGADTLSHMRGKGVAPGSKPHLFFLGFQLLGLNRIETGCLVSNTASKRSIEKTPGFVYEGTLREQQRNDEGDFEDVYFYAILKRDWENLYQPDGIEVVP